MLQNSLKKQISPFLTIKYCPTCANCFYFTLSLNTLTTSSICFCCSGLSFTDSAITPVLPSLLIYSVIAEKFEAIVSLGDANSRYKDFYDIYLIADNYELDGEILKDAVQETFAHRNTTFNDIFAFKSAFINSPIHNSRWDVFLNKKKATVKVELERVIVIIRDLLLPISESIISGKEFTSIWNNKDRAWQ